MSDSTHPLVATAGGDDADVRPWKRALIWLCVLGPFFFLSYGFANWLAAQHADVGSIVFAWERSIPFLEWTIIPYWSIDVLYVCALFVCTSRVGVDTLGKRLLSAQVLAVLCFIAFPLSFSFERPETHGLTGGLFSLLESFDQPFNQAPSLHIALLVILWRLYIVYVPRRWHWALHGWFALIGLSVLTTYQHHFIDVPTGALLGWFCVWLWPEDRPSPLYAFRPTRDRCHPRLAAAYTLGGLAFAGVACALGGGFLWLFWPAVSLFLVATAYLAFGVDIFQKSATGRMSQAAQWLLAPYLLAAMVNSRLWTQAESEPVHIAGNVWIGRFPSSCDLAKQGFDHVVDLTAELPAPPQKGNWHSVPSLDLTTPSPKKLRKTAKAIETLRQSGRVLVCCALGYSRSAGAVATWLLMTKRSQNLHEVITVLRKARPHIVLTKAHLSAIRAAMPAA